jgi:hypothetical protein
LALIADFSGQFEDANIILSTMEPLRPLLVLLSWDRFEDDILSRQTLTRILWPNIVCHSIVSLIAQKEFF